ncbi:MAG: extracellular solute-binding protein [Chloroflexota bacterium]
MARPTTACPPPATRRSGSSPRATWRGLDTSTIPGFDDVASFLGDAPLDGKRYGVPHGWGGNLLMYQTDEVTPAPTSWDVVFDETAAAPYAGRITAYDSAIYIADAAMYLKAHQPELGITDVYELTPEQLDAAVALLKQQAPWVGKYWSLFGDEIDNFTNGSTVVGTSWPYQVNALKGAGVPVEAVVPSEGMTGWADTWMMSANAPHPNCMQKWMAWMITPEVQAQVAEYFGESPANPKACQYLDVGYGSYQLPGFCDAFGVNDPAVYESISFWKTPLVDCGDDRGEACTDYDTWTAKWTEIRGSWTTACLWGPGRHVPGPGKAPRTPDVSALTPAVRPRRSRAACGGAPCARCIVTHGGARRDPDAARRMDGRRLLRLAGAAHGLGVLRARPAHLHDRARVQPSRTSRPS